QGTSTINIHRTWDRIIAESRSRTTLQNAIEAERIVAEKKMTRVILVTSDYHMPRASLMFADTLKGVELVRYPVASEFSRGEALGYRKLAYEYVKMLLYRVGILRLLSR